MQITINIPKEFENHFNSDKFEDSLQRVRFDIHKAIIAKKDILSGNYEIETLDMLTEAFLKGTPLSKGHGNLIDENELLETTKSYKSELGRLKVDPFVKSGIETVERFIKEMSPIIEADKESEEWYGKSNQTWKWSKRSYL